MLGQVGLTRYEISNFSAVVYIHTIYNIVNLSVFFCKCRDMRVSITWRIGGEVTTWELDQV